MDLINAVFDDKRPACISGKVTDLTVEDRELFPQHQRDKQGRLDIRAETSTGEMIDIEVYTYTESLGPRSLYYFSKLFTSQPSKGYDYDSLKPAVIINLLAYSIFKKRAQYHSCYELRERTEGDLLTDKLSIHIIEAQKSDLSSKNKNRLLKWLGYLSNKAPAAVAEVAKDDQLFSKILEAEKMFVRDLNEMRAYEAQERYEMDMATLLKAKHNQGIAIGEERGIEIGEARGELKKALQTAKAMLSAGEPIERIKLYTQLSDEQIAALQ